MSTQQYLCKNPRRIAALRAAAQELPPRWFNGIEYLEVMHGEPRLVLHFVQKEQLRFLLFLFSEAQIRTGYKDTCNNYAFFPDQSRRTILHW